MMKIYFEDSESFAHGPCGYNLKAIRDCLGASDSTLRTYFTSSGGFIVKRFVDEKE